MHLESFLFFYSLQSWEGGTDSFFNSIVPKKSVWPWPSFLVSLIFRVRIISLPVFLSAYIPNITINSQKINIIHYMKEHAL